MYMMQTFVMYRHGHIHTQTHTHPPRHTHTHTHTHRETAKQRDRQNVKGRTKDKIPQLQQTGRKIGGHFERKARKNDVYNASGLAIRRGSNFVDLPRTGALACEGSYRAEQLLHPLRHISCCPKALPVFPRSVFRPLAPKCLASFSQGQFEAS